MARRRLPWLLLLTNCNDPSTAEEPQENVTEWVAGAFCQEGPDKVDILLVAESSASMGAHAERMATNLRWFGEAFESTELDYRVAVTTTSLSSPRCEAAGVLVDTSCRERLGDFVVDGNEALDLRPLCKASCGLDQLGPLPQPWLERAGGRANTADPAESLACMGQVGIAACTSPSPFDAAVAALDRAVDPGDPAYGLVRPDARLVLIFIGDADGRSDVSEARLVDRLEELDVEKRRFMHSDEPFVFVTAVANPEEHTRTKRVASRFAPGSGALASIDTADWGEALAWLPVDLRQPRPLCFEGPDMNHPEGVCVAIEQVGETSRRLPSCEAGAQVPREADACVRLLKDDELDQTCIDEGYAGELIVVQREPLAAARCIEVVCEVGPSE